MKTYETLKTIGLDYEPEESKEKVDPDAVKTLQQDVEKLQRPDPFGDNNAIWNR